MAQKKKRKKKRRASGSAPRHTGMMSAMRGGMQRAVRGKPAPSGKSSPAGTAFTVALILAAVALLLWRFA